MAAKRKKPSALKSKYMKERRRIQRTINRYKKRGLDVQFLLPDIPKKITQGSINRLKKITPKSIQTKTYGVDIETGEQLSYYKATQVQRKARAKARRTPPQPQPTQPYTKEEYPTFADSIIEGFRYLISNYPPAVESIAKKWLSDMLNEYSRNDVSKMLQESRRAGVWLEPYELYHNEQKVVGMLNAMMDFMEMDEDDRSAFQIAISEEYDMWEGEIYG